MITHVAIRYNGIHYSMRGPYRHHDVIRMIAKENGVGIAGPDVQGFLDHTGRFLTRKQAMNHALACGQVTGRQRMEELYSEDLW